MSQLFIQEIQGGEKSTIKNKGLWDISYKPSIKCSNSKK